jgi:hypothetical protein
MSEVQNTTDTNESDQDESSVIQGFRDREASLKAKLKEQDKALEEMQAQTSAIRESAAGGIVDALGFPGLKNDVLGWVEGEVTEDKVTEALKVRGLLQGGESAKDEDPKPKPKPASELGQLVADVASGGAEKDLDARIKGAKSGEEIDALMVEADYDISYA